jgi:hypothetical protein
MKKEQKNEVDDIVDLKNRLEAKEFVLRVHAVTSEHSPHNTSLTVHLNSGIAYFDELQAIVDELKGYTHDRIMVSVTSDRCGDSYLAVDINNIRRQVSK